MTTSTRPDQATVSERRKTASPPDTAAARGSSGLAAAFGLGLASLTAALMTAVVVLRLGGGADAAQLPGMPVADPVVQWALPVTRVLSDAAAVVTVGLLLAAAVFSPIPRRSTERRATTVGPHAYRWVRAAGWAALAWFAATVLGVGYTVADLLGRPLGEVIGDLSAAGAVVEPGQPIPGLLLVAGLVAVLVVACRAVLSRGGVTVLLVVALAATVPPAFSGHSAGGSGDHRVAVSAMLLHIVGVVLWAGGLLALTLAHRLSPADLDRAVRRFSRLAGWCLAAVGGSGLVNVIARLDPLSELWRGWYGWLVLAKLGAFGLLAAVGAAHRTRTLPALRQGRPLAFTRLATVELVIFAATIGLAVGLSRTPTPTGEVDTGAHGAAELDSVAMPDPPGLHSLLLDWRPEPVFLTVAAIAIAVYLAGVRRLRRSGRSWPLVPAASWVAGWLLVAWVTSGGLVAYGEVLFSTGLIQHLALALPIPLLLVAGRPITLAQRTLRPAGDPRWPGPREWLRDLLRSRLLRVLVRPQVALAVQAAVAYLLFFAGFYDTMLRSHAIHLVTYGLVLAMGYAFWWGATGLDAAPHRPTPRGQAVVLGASVALLDLLGVGLMRTHTDIGGFGDTGLARPWGPSVLGDQILAGQIVLWVAGAASLLIATVAVCTGRLTKRPMVTDVPTG